MENSEGMTNSEGSKCETSEKESSKVVDQVISLKEFRLRASLMQEIKGYEPVLIEGVFLLDWEEGLSQVSDTTDHLQQIL